MKRITGMNLFGAGVLFALPLACYCLAAPGGDLAKQQPKWHLDYIPPAPVRTPQEELKTFKLPPGFHMELVAAEPMVEEPISLTFDPDGRMYVVELRAYMPDIPGTGEIDNVGQIVRLESSKGDGIYDRRTVFADKLSLPRTVSLAADGVLISEPPNIYFCKEKKDGTVDRGTPILTDFASHNPNPEHQANGLVPCLDNWYYSANWPVRIKYSKGQFLRDSTISRGQWGITQDDVGRLYYNTNGSMLRCDLFPSQYLLRNPYLPSPAGVNVAVADNKTHPGRVTPGINRGYTADDDMHGTLQRVTASCGPAVYRGQEFPPEFEGNVFVCEPAGNMVIRHVITQTGVAISAKSVQTDGVDFLTSQDERFRPVSLYTAPDGTLYVVDMYHGILQHKAYLSAYLADQVRQRHLEDKGAHHGRIWRVVADSGKPGPQPKLAAASAADLVNTLSHPNGWWRDTAQRLLVERRDPASVPLLEAVVTGKSADPTTVLAKVHALWALAGAEKLSDNIAAAALKDADPRVRVAAMQAADVLLHKHLAPNTESAMAQLAGDGDPEVQLQILATGSADIPDIQQAAMAILARQMDDKVFRTAAISSAAGRELELAQVLLSDKRFAEATSGKSELLSELAECMVKSRSQGRVEEVLDLIAKQPASGKSAQQALLKGVADAVVPVSNSKSKIKFVTRRLRLTRQPPALPALLALADKKLHHQVEQIEENMSWPNKPGDKTPPLKPLTAPQQARFETGRTIFTQICAQCHQPSGLGQDGVAPPLVDSEWVLGSSHRLVRIVLNGVHGPITVGRKSVELEMPGLGALDDEQVSSVLTYLRREWGHEGAPIEPTDVKEIRSETGARGELLWTMKELLEIK
jgi:mono/diheme cytochrome c family protein/glucose/arabinose dehydrogenase